MVSSLVEVLVIVVVAPTLVELASEVGGSENEVSLTARSVVELPHDRATSATKLTTA
jgi:hypothetical protein